MTMPFYSSVDQLLRDRSELARKGIARGRSVVVLTFTDGVLFVAENRSTALHKVSEIYDRIGFAAVGRYNEFETLRNAGVRMADVRGYTYDRRDVTGRMLANTYAQVLGTSFVEQQKPYEVELCLAEVGATAETDQLYRITYDGSITDEPQFVVMGGTTEPISAKLKETYRPGLPLTEAIAHAVEALQASSSTAGNGTAQPAVLGVRALEVAVLDRGRPRRSFRRITGSALRELLPEANRAVDAPEGSGDVGGDASPVVPENDVPEGGPS
ncbi:proteasome subunit alpha [Pseudonocardia hydrocarbonoxydans]|uniref:Proteasome subunit alpha n=1 Tax=Pseudonocardia hydrocarbonoxydans TaxID=76726 RepID=A0A4Y3WGT9_9PSEU|nr:proteasome subunit alpha [Pseudonocardia hydrocarbonoxydans]GEC18064.1 proteasome subunit alpha [Pseudonocardia hydrocarbonoxydans]